MKPTPFIVSYVDSLLKGATLSVHMKEMLNDLTLVSLTEWAILAITKLVAGEEIDYHAAELEMLRIHIRLNYTDEEYKRYNDYITWYGEQLEPRS